MQFSCKQKTKHFYLKRTMSRVDHQGQREGLSVYVYIEMCIFKSKIQVCDALTKGRLSGRQNRNIWVGRVALLGIQMKSIHYCISYMIQNMLPLFFVFLNTWVNLVKWERKPHFHKKQNDALAILVTRVSLKFLRYFFLHHTYPSFPSNKT